ncbi:AbrB/MazE/SpoVT family DNA-binding domain-containing protein [Virgibacillus natechei]|uniref:AbrB/MazE/SpoVT family DNA-binding domain-containing protein n=1 Tax=Virgibacillus sp. CBA3643 TaxID=2942278 RepID=UPI0035A2C4B1
MKDNKREDPTMISETPNKHHELEGKLKISSKGQLVIPAEVRKAAGMEKGQHLRYRYEDGKIILEAENYLSAEELLGFFDNPEDTGDFILDLDQARDDRTQEILDKDV